MRTFDKEDFSYKLKLILETYNSITEMANKIPMDRSHLSKYINCKFDNPPSIKTLDKIYKASNGVATFEGLLNSCGYSYERTTEKSIFSVDWVDKILKVIEKMNRNEKIEKLNLTIENLQQDLNLLSIMISDKDYLELSDDIYEETKNSESIILEKIKQCQDLLKEVEAN